MGKKTDDVEAPEAPEAAADILDEIDGQSKRCGFWQSGWYSFFLLLVTTISILCFFYPQETHTEETGGVMKFGPDAKKLKDNFKLEKDGGEISFTWLCMMLSTLFALQEFVLFSVTPGWTYKLRFRGADSCPTSCVFALCPVAHLCGRNASANDEQTHQADQMSRLAGIFIGLAFGLINFFTRLGMQKVGEGCIAHFGAWFMVGVFHFSSCCNGGAPSMYSVYLCISSFVLSILMLMCSGALNDMFDLNKLMADYI
jgi:hypothetical protein